MTERDTSPKSRRTFEQEVPEGLLDVPSLAKLGITPSLVDEMALDEPGVKGLVENARKWRTAAFRTDGRDLPPDRFEELEETGRRLAAVHQALLGPGNDERALSLATAEVLPGNDFARAVSANRREIISAAQRQEAAEERILKTHRQQIDPSIVTVHDLRGKALTLLDSETAIALAMDIDSGNKLNRGALWMGQVEQARDHELGIPNEDLALALEIAVDALQEIDLRVNIEIARDGSITARQPDGELIEDYVDSSERLYAAIPAESCAGGIMELLRDVGLFEEAMEYHSGDEIQIPDEPSEPEGLRQLARLVRLGNYNTKQIPAGALPGLQTEGMTLEAKKDFYLITKRVSPSGNPVFRILGKIDRLPEIEEQ